MKKEVKRVSKKWLEIRNQAEITEIFINGDIENDAYNDGMLEVWGIKTLIYIQWKLKML